MFYYIVQHETNGQNSLPFHHFIRLKINYSPFFVWDPLGFPRPHFENHGPRECKIKTAVGLWLQRVKGYEQ